MKPYILLAILILMPFAYAANFNIVSQWNATAPEGGASKTYAQILYENQYKAYTVYDTSPWLYVISWLTGKSYSDNARDRLEQIQVEGKDILNDDENTLIEGMQSTLYDLSTPDNIPTTQNQSFEYIYAFENNKAIQEQNINLMWSHITSLLQIIYEIIYLLFQLTSFYIAVWVLIDALPNIMIFTRDLIMALAGGNRK